MRDNLATIDGRSVTLNGETREGVLVGPFMVHRGFDFMRSQWTLTAPSGSCLGYYPSRALAGRAAEAFVAAFPSYDWHAMPRGAKLPRDMAQDLLAISLRFVR